MFRAKEGGSDCQSDPKFIIIIQNVLYSVHFGFKSDLGQWNILGSQKCQNLRPKTLTAYHLPKMTLACFLLKVTTKMNHNYQKLCALQCPFRF